MKFVPPVSSCGVAQERVSDTSGKLIDYSEEEIHIYSQARTIHEASKAYYCNEKSLEITSDDLEISN